MKLKQTENQEIVIGAQSEMSFSIDDSNPVIFDILRNKMYSNKIGAICREVASNSRDANREAGLGDQAIEIEFTKKENAFSVGDKCIIFRDFGIGITPDRMENIFVKYAASTKRDSNAQTGGFGLGAKTPFAYTDSFFVKTVCNWKKPIIGKETVEKIVPNKQYNKLIVDNVEFTTLEGNIDTEYAKIRIEENVVVGHEEEKTWEFLYNAILDRTGRGKMILLNSYVVEDQPTGTEIVVPIVSEADARSFEEEVFRYTMFWDNVNYINFHTKKPNIEPVMEIGEYKLIESNQSFLNSNYIGLIDGIPYPLQPSHYRSGFGDYSAVFEIDVDNVTINANRESIQNDDPDTQAYIDLKVEELRTLFLEEAEKLVTTHNTIEDAFKLKYDIDKNSGDAVSNLLKEAFNNYYSGRICYGKRLKVKFDGEEISDTLGLKNHDFIILNHSVKEVDGEDVYHFSYKKSNTLKYLDPNIVYIDTSSYSKAKNIKLVNEASGKHVLFIRPSKKASEEEVKEEFQRLLDLNVDMQLYSEVKDTKKKVKTVRTFNTVKEIPVRVNTNHWHSHYIDFDGEQKIAMEYGKAIGFDEVAFYPIDNLKQALDYNYTDDRDMADLLISLKRIKKVYVINKKMFKRFKKVGYKTIKDIFSEYTKEELMDMREYKKICNVLSNNFHQILLDEFPHILPKSISTILKKKQELEVKDFTLENRHIKWDTIGVPESKFDYDGLVKKFNNIMDEKYPLILPYLKNNSYIEENYDKVKQILENYIKSV